MTERTRDRLARELRAVAAKASPENAARYEAFASRAMTGEFDDYADTYICPIHQRRFAFIWSPPAPSVGLVGISFGRRMLGLQWLPFA